MIKLSLALITAGGATIALWQIPKLSDPVRYLLSIITFMGFIVGIPPTIEALEWLNKKYDFVHHIATAAQKTWKVLDDTSAAISRAMEPGPCVAIVYDASGKAAWNYGKNCSLSRAQSSCPECSGRTVAFQTVAVVTCRPDGQIYSLADHGVNQAWAEHYALQSLYRAGWSNCSTSVVVDPVNGKLR